MCSVAPFRLAKFSRKFCCLKLLVCGIRTIFSGPKNETASNGGGGSYANIHQSISKINKICDDMLRTAIFPPYLSPLFTFFRKRSRLLRHLQCSLGRRNSGTERIGKEAPLKCQFIF